MIARFFAWMERVADEKHHSQRLAARWHAMHAVVCGAAVLCFVGECLYHLGARRVHRRALERGKPEPWEGA